MIRGSVDTITRKSATGWIYSDERTGSLSVEAALNHQVIGNAIANLPRPDLAEAGFGNGNCGFDIRFANEIDNLYLPFVQVTLAGTDLELRRWTAAGFRDYFQALYQSHPIAGRSASVFGGLWTDRTDAPAMLKGRTDIGLLTRGQANILARVINDGAVVITREPGSTKPNASRGTPNGMASTVADVLFDGSILGILRCILDDNPVAVRADALNVNVDEFAQMSALDDLPSPAECLGLVFPAQDSAVVIEVIRDGHHLPEFLPNGLSRWTHAAAHHTATAALSPNIPVDRHVVPKGSAMLIGPGALFRVRAATAGAVRVLVLPSRLSLLRFHQKPPTAELANDSGARVWV
jgi:hypothetical protein